MFGTTTVVTNERTDKQGDGGMEDTEDGEDEEYEWWGATPETVEVPRAEDAAEWRWQGVQQSLIAELTWEWRAEDDGGSCGGGGGQQAVLL